MDWNAAQVTSLRGWSPLRCSLRPRECSYSSERTTTSATNARSTGICHFLRLPVELPEIVYKMLLTTPYCTSLDDGVCLTCPWNINGPSYGGRAWRFHLHTAILLVNKQISAEAMIMLYQGNDFIVLKGPGKNLWIDAIPRFGSFPHLVLNSMFEPLARSKIDPVLRIEVTSTGIEMTDSQYLITTPKGLLPVIRSLWIKETERPYRIGMPICKLTLDFNLGAASQSRVLSELITKPWERFSVIELVLRGDIREPMREYLEQSNLRGPFPNVVAAHFKEYNSLAEQAFEREDYIAAQWGGASWTNTGFMFHA